MKIILLSKGVSPHTKKWSQSLIKKGFRVYVISLLPAEIEGVKVIHVNPPSLPFKLGYFFVIPKIRNIIKNIEPDIVHAHYASSYGLLGAVSGFHPYIISVWGSDVFDFPKNNVLNRFILKFSLSRADLITSTSNMMAKETRIYAPNKQVKVVPFGVDTSVFHPQIKKGAAFFIGTARALEEKYGVEYLIKAFNLISKEITESILYIAGEGSLEVKLKNLANKFKLEKRIVFLGFLKEKSLAKYIRGLDIFVMPSVSDSESFGVAALEASASGVSVVASKIGGLEETVKEGKTGLFCRPADEKDLAKKIIYLYKNTTLRQEFSQEGPRFVKSKFDFDQNIKEMIEIYRKISKKK